MDWNETWQLAKDSSVFGISGALVGAVWGVITRHDNISFNDVSSYMPIVTGALIGGAAGQGLGMLYHSRLQNWLVSIPLLSGAGVGGYHYMNRSGDTNVATDSINRGAVAVVLGAAAAAGIGQITG